MSRPVPPVSIGIDFGTSNTVVALAADDGRAEAITFHHNGQDLKGFVTALCYWQDRVAGKIRSRVDGGPWAMDQLMEGGTAHRFIQSFKTFAASASFQETRIFGQRYGFEDLLVSFIQTLTRHAGGALDFAGARVQIGRPVHFAGSNPDDALAMQRYRTAFGKLGLDQASYVYEPVGAAFFYARELTHDATVLVADFGGGTSDFSVMRFERRGGRLHAEPLAHSGIGIAGDAFDYRIVDHVVSPVLGKGSDYQSLGKRLTIPNRYYANLAKWHQLAMMKSNGDLAGLRDLEKVAIEPAMLAKFIDIIDYDLGLALYRAVSEAKVALSSADATDFRFAAEGVEIAGRITRKDFESWIAPDVERIATTIDEALAKAGVGDRDIEQVFLTGGTSFVPAIRNLFTSRFDETKLTNTDQFESIAYGLALIGREAEAARWAA
ncbi:Hsp70 family protein [Phreatobacter aquaticus]|uniref:Hsp70 family protein n=1 Tax=Phreatobacter aquaticus TaxID=2570229 RepID=A0A4D7QJP6_9HYPH|nr:Hsp70 family protein [Phreatobacter aquaticus]QCK84552.1 Hsp70 family protein [Phreatobacter aquaticus]